MCFLSIEIEFEKKPGHMFFLSIEIEFEKKVWANVFSEYRNGIKKNPGHRQFPSRKLPDLCNSAHNFLFLVAEPH